MTDLRFTHTIDLEHVGDFFDYLRPSKEHWGTGVECDWYFRGQADAKWDLIPSAWRPEGQSWLEPYFLKIETGFNQESMNDSDNWSGQYRSTLAAIYQAVNEFSEVADEIGHPIMNAGIDYTESPRTVFIHGDGYGAPPDAMAIAQHHHVPTILLDWTRNPLYAAYFACEDALKRNDAERIAVWAIQRNEIHGSLNVKNAPLHSGSFINAQEGLFTWTGEQFCQDEKPHKWPTIQDAIEKKVRTPSDNALRCVTLPTSLLDDLHMALFRERIHAAKIRPSYDYCAKVLQERLDLETGKGSK